ncbi:MFS transporter [Streptomyces sp. 4N124]|uniref:MFS transporter n=1 Tax=Streptomyces sp. 4N124 TaxID=3457420 RepID=UPI003FD54DAE
MTPAQTATARGGLLRGEHGRPLTVLAAGVFLLWAAMMSVFPALPDISEDLGLRSGSLGTIMAVSSLVMTGMSIPAGVLADRYGRRPLILGGLTLCVPALLIAALPWQPAAAFAVGWVLFGVGRGLFLSPAFTVPADLFPPQLRGRAIGALAGMIGIGSVVGYVGGGALVATAGWRAVLVVDAVLVGAAAVAVAGGVPESAKERHRTPLGVAAVQTFDWFRSRTILLSGLVAGLAFAVGVAATFLVPFSLSALDASAFVIAAVFVPYEIVAAVGTIVAGQAADRVGRKPPMLVALALLGLALAALPAAGVSVWTVAVVYAFVGVAEGPIISLATTMVSDEVLARDPRRLGSAMGANRLAQGVGPVVGPVLGGLLAEHLAAGTRFRVLAVVCALTFAVALLLRETRPRTVDGSA